MKNPLKCIKPGCTGTLKVARLQWNYTTLEFDPARYEPEAALAAESLVPSARVDDSFGEGEDDELGDLDERKIECDACATQWEEDAEELVAAVRAMAAEAKP